MSTDYDKPIGPWRRQAREHGEGVIRKLTPAELQAAVLYADERVVVINKAWDIPCHPSKDGPWSSLSGAVREFFGEAAAHLVFRLDRETSGVVVYARDTATARRLQMAVQRRKYSKTYLAILCGQLREPVSVDQPLGPDYDCEVTIKNRVVAPDAERAQEARTRFEPISWCGGSVAAMRAARANCQPALCEAIASSGFTLVRVTTETGRKHQIRAHAQWLGYALAGDKIYGPDARLFLEFVETGWTPRLAERLLLPRQALHCESVDLRAAGVEYVFQAPLAEDLRKFWECAGGVFEK